MNFNNNANLSHQYYSIVMKKFICFFSIIALINTCIAQSLVVKNFEELTHDLSARTNTRIDEEGNHCALIRINVPTIKSLVFDNTVVGEAQYLPGEYIVYVSNG